MDNMKRNGKKENVMKRMIAWMTALTCMLCLISCTGGNEDERTTTETGYPAGEIQQPQIMYNGWIYLYYATGFDEPLPEGFECVGTVTAVDNINGPESNFSGARVDFGQEIYANHASTDAIYVRYPTGYARFAISESADE